MFLPLRRFVFIGATASLPLALSCASETQSGSDAASMPQPSIDASGAGDIAFSGVDAGNIDSLQGTAAAPSRLIVFVHPFGMLDEAFTLAKPTIEATSEQGWSIDLTAGAGPLSRTLQPLAALRDHLTVVAGMAMYTNFAANGMRPDMLLTGQKQSVYSDRMFKASGPSMDWLVAQHNKSESGVPLVVVGRPPSGSFSFDAQGTMIPAKESPQAAYVELFPNGTLAAACQAGSLPAAVSVSSLRPLGEWVDRMIPVLTSAFRCDRTRVFTLAPPLPSNEELGIGPGSLDQDFADRVGPPGTTNQVHLRAREAMAKYNAYLAEQVARIANALEAVPEKQATLLDHSLIAWMSQEGQPGHRSIPWHLVLVGGKGMGLNTGRYLQLAQTHLVNEGGSEQMAGPPHNQALVSLARLFGLDTTTVGLSEFSVSAGTKVAASGGILGL